jgi:hypothetical protein
MKASSLDRPSRRPRSFATRMLWQGLRQLDLWGVKDAVRTGADLTSTAQRGRTPLVFLIQNPPKGDHVWWPTFHAIEALLLEQGAAIHVGTCHRPGSLFRHALAFHTDNHLSDTSNKSHAACVQQVRLWIHRLTRDGVDWVPIAARHWGQFVRKHGQMTNASSRPSLEVNLHCVALATALIRLYFDEGAAPHPFWDVRVSHFNKEIHFPSLWARRRQTQATDLPQTTVPRRRWRT